MNDRDVRWGRSVQFAKDELVLMEEPIDTGLIDYKFWMIRDQVATIQVIDRKTSEMRFSAESFAPPSRASVGAGECCGGLSEAISQPIYSQALRERKAKSEPRAALASDRRFADNALDRFRDPLAERKGYKEPTVTWTPLLLSLACLGAPIEADVILRNGTIHDGSGQAASTGDVAIRGDRIVAVGRFETAGQPRVIDASGLIVAPGFIDLHSHSDQPILKPETQQNLNFLKQGVTSIVTGNCGSGHVDVATYLKRVDEHGAGTNVLHLIPHGSLRRQVIGEVDRPATANELRRMKELVEQGMRDGAWGMATGLIYVPGTYASTEELIALAEIVGRHGGLYASHIRNENTRLLESVEEALKIGREAKLPVHISHFKASGRDAWGLAAPALELVRTAREAGQMVTADQYPYPASSTSLAAMVIPTRFRSGKDWRKGLDDPNRLPAIRQAIEQSLAKRDGGSSLFVAGYAKNRAWQGKDMATLAAETGRPAVDLVLEIERNGGAQMVSFGMSEEEVRLIMQQPFMATASDGSAKTLTDSTVPHPRSFGCFPRKIGHYAIRGQVLPVEQAIRSASGLPADILRLPQRGYLRDGYAADIVVLDPETFIDTATYDKPLQHATGVRYLFVNGQLAIHDGESTDVLAGKALRRE